MKNINWIEVQNYYNDNHTWNDIIKEFNISSNTINKAVKNEKLKMRSKSDANKIASIKFPKKLTEETKKKISESRKKYLKEHPDQVPYLLNHFSKGESYPERYFQIILQKSNLSYERYLQISYYNLDFAFIEKGIDLEIDGDQHYLDQKIVESNKERDIFLKNKGWSIIRISWSEYRRMKNEERRDYIKNLIDYIKGEEGNLPKMINNKKYCNCGKQINKRSKMCVKCRPKKRKVENRPSLEDIIFQLTTESYEKVGKKYNVTGNCIKKWIIKYGAEPPKKQNLRQYP